MFNFSFLKYSLTLFILLGFWACDDDENHSTEGNIEMSISGNINNQTFELNQEYTTIYGDRVSFSLFKFYLSNIELVNNGGESVLIKEVDLFDFAAPSSISAELIPTGNYTQLRFGLGLNPELNQSDPATFDFDHPLGVAHGTHWNWAQKYKFAMIEGRTDNDPNTTNLENAFAYHTGFDELFRSIELPIDFTVTGDQTNNLELEIDINRIFYNETDTINLIEESFSHTVGDGLPLATQITENFVGAFSVK